jgi:hypothetical protein
MTEFSVRVERQNNACQWVWLAYSTNGYGGFGLHPGKMAGGVEK